MEIATPPPAQNARRVARAEAAAWVVRLHSPERSEEVEAGFRDWLVADPENGRQFERVTEVWDAGAVPVAGVPRMRRWPLKSPTRTWALAAAAALAVIAVVSWGTSRFWLTPSYSTGIGEQRSVRLEDGSRVSLNSNTRVSVSYHASERLIRIERGEAYFEVAHNPAWPFVVVAGDRQVTALGTTFVVKYDASATAVTLVEGKVTVTGGRGEKLESDANSVTQQQPAVMVGTNGRGFILAPGERLTFKGAAARLDVPHMDAVTAWRRGEVLLDRTTLADAVAEMNRYDEAVLIIDDPGVADLRVSGIYHTGNSDGFAQTMARLYGLRVIHEDGRVHLRLPPEGIP
ncbi:MAG: FecR domain-containing protein [Gammaproteobacteria bacterium]